MLYIGRQRKQKNVGFLFDVVKFFFTPLHCFRVNLTTDNWFTSSQLSADFSGCQTFLTYGTKKM